MWTKVAKFKGRSANLKGRKTRETPAVHRCRSGHQHATLVLPVDMANGARASIYSDGNGKLAFAIGERGDYAVFQNGNTATTKRITIPSRWARLIPFGTTDVSISTEGDMLVLDLNKLPLVLQSIAAE